MAATEDWARPVVRWEIRAREPEVLQKFYGELFNWNIADGPVMNIPAGIGGPEPGPDGHIIKSDRVGVTLYIQVRDLRASIARAIELGGTATFEPFDVPGGPTIAGILDPEDNPVTLVQQ